MGRRISTATAVSEVWDSHQATLHRPCCVQKAGSKTGVAMKSQNPSKSAGGLKQCPFCIQSEMMILRYLKSPTPFLVDWELSAMRPKKTPGFRRWIWWDLWRPLPGDPFGFDQLALVLLQDIDLSVFTVLLYLNCITVGPGIGRYLILLHESTHCCGIKPNRCGQTNPSCWLYLDGCWQNSEFATPSCLQRSLASLSHSIGYHVSIFFNIFRYFSSAWKQQNEGQKTEHHGIGDQQAKQPGMPTRGAVAEIDSDIWLVFAASSARCVHFTLEVYVSRPGKTFLFSFVGFYKYVFMDMSQPGVANSGPTMAYLDSRFDATFELLLPAESY